MNTLRENSGPATMVVFDVQVVPPMAAAKARVPIQFLVKPDTITADEQKDGQRGFNLDFYVTAFSVEGKMVGNSAKTVNTTITAEQFTQVQQQGLMTPLELSLPPGDFDLRLAVRDNRTGYLGTLSLPSLLQKQVHEGLRPQTESRP